MRSRRRWLQLGTGVLALAQCGWWIFSGWGVWYFRGFMLEPSSSQIANNSRFAVALFAVAAINVGALIGFLVRPRGWGELVLAAVFLGNVAFSLWAAVSRNNVTWLVLGGGPAAAALVLVLLFRSTASETSA